MTDSVFQQVVDALAGFRIDAAAFSTFLTAPTGVTVDFVSSTGDTVTIPSLNSELEAARDRIPNPTGQPVGAFIAVNSALMPAYTDFTFNFPVAGMERQRMPVVFNETAAGVRTLDLLPYSLPEPAVLSSGSILVYDGVNFIPSVYSIQNDGFLPTPMVGEPAINRLAMVSSEHLSDGSISRRFRESSIRVPTGAELSMAENLNKFFLSGAVNGEARLFQSSYQIPADTTGTVEGSTLVVNAMGNLEFSTLNLADIIQRDTPPARLDFLRINAEYSEGRLAMTRNSDLPATDPDDLDTFLDGAMQQDSQAKFVSSSFQLDTATSSRYGILAATFTGTASTDTLHINFGCIGTNVLPANLPWADNRDSVANDVVIYREHDLVLHEGRRYYVNFDVTPTTNPVPGTNTTMGGVTVDPSPFIPYNCGVPVTPQMSPFTAVNQIIYATVGDVAFLNPPADNTGFYGLSHQAITINSIERLQPIWNLIETGSPPLPPNLGAIAEVLNSPITRIYPSAGGRATVALFVGAGTEISPLYAAAQGDYLNSSRVTAITSRNFLENYGNDPTSFSRNNTFQTRRDFANNIGVAGYALASIGGLLLGGDGRARVVVTDTTTGTANYRTGYYPEGVFNLGQIVTPPGDENNDFVRIYDQNIRTTAGKCFLEKSDGSCWMYGNLGELNTGSNDTAQPSVFTNTGLTNIVKILHSTDELVVALESNGAMWASGRDPLTPLADQATGGDFYGNFRRIFASIPDPANPGSTLPLNIVNFDIHTIQQNSCIVFMTSGGRAYTHFTSDIADLRWGGSAAFSAGTTNLLPPTGVVDVRLNQNSNDTTRSAQYVSVLTSSRLFANRSLTGSNVSAESVAELIEHFLPVNSGWTRLVSGGRSGDFVHSPDVIHSSGRIAVSSRDTEVYGWL